MTPFVTLDIETVAQARYREPGSYEPDPDWLDAQYPDGVRDDPESGQLMEQWRGGHVPVKATRVPPALHPTTNRIVQVSFGRRGKHDAVVHQLYQWNDLSGWSDPAQADDVERRLVTAALECLAAFLDKKWLLVTFNGKDFDQHVLRWRAALLGATIPRLPWEYLRHPYNEERHLDLRLLLGNHNRRAYGTLQWWAEAFGIPARECGHLVQQWVDAGQWDELRSYGAAEARTLVELYEVAVLGTRAPSLPESDKLSL